MGFAGDTRFRLKREAIAEAAVPSSYFPQSILPLLRHPPSQELVLLFAG